MRKYLDADQARLYDMIWKRAIASQMQPAEIERTTAEIEAVNGAARGLRAVGSVVRFDGFIAAYTDQKDDDDEDDERMAACRKSVPTSARQAQDRCKRRSISPSRRRAIPRRA